MLSFLFPSHSNADEWDLKVTAVLSSNDKVIKTDLIAGIRLSGSDDFDNLWDTKKAFDSDFLSSVVTLSAFWSHSEYDQGKDKLLRDFRGDIPSEWNMSVSTNVEQEVTLYWILPEKTGCNIPALTLVDMGHNVSLNMSDVNHYTFISNQDANSILIQASPQENLTAPATPLNVWVPISTENRIMLVWTKSLEDNIKGYNVYRKETKESSYKRINPTIKSTNKYLDNYLEPDKEYQYAVTAVGNCESNFSEEVYVSTFQ